ncbi:hypothetical protein CMU26_01080 [Elizabethkingia anophelis]|nr:hypothetical protein [Elizabethkingia anophelis]
MSNQRDIFLTLHSNYEKKAFRMILKEFRKLLKGIPFDNITMENAKYVILLNINEENLRNVIQKVYLTIGLQYGRMVEKAIRKEEKAFRPYGLFSRAFQFFVYNFFRNEGGFMIRSLTETMATQVMNEMSKGLEQGETLKQMQERVRKTVNKPGFYRWQAMRIARTETTTAMNAAKEIAVDESGLVVEKVWVHGHPKQSRVDHLAMDGRTVAGNESFILPSGVEMKYPGDKSGGASETINCTCTFSYKPKRDENGRLIFKD